MLALEALDDLVGESDDADGHIVVDGHGAALVRVAGAHDDGRWGGAAI